LGADAVELDVRLTADGIPVVFHYFYLDKHTRLPGTIFQYTWDEVSRARVLLSSTSEPAEIKIPSLDEVLAALAGHIGLEIEIKGPEPECIEAITRALRNHPSALERLEITSYETTLLERFQHRMPDIPTDLLIPLSEPWMKPDVLAYTTLNRSRLASARAVHLHASQLIPDVVNTIRQGGCEVHAWGVNDLPAWKSVVDLQVARACTDNLQLALQYREEWKIL
jgi:glycerophosphoryl diester phosphodiesterase